MFCYFCEDGNFFLLTKDDQKVLIDCLNLLMPKKILISFLFSTALVKKRRNCPTVTNCCHPVLNWVPSAC